MYKRGEAVPEQIRSDEILHGNQLAERNERSCPSALDREAEVMFKSGVVTG